MMGRIGPRRRFFNPRDYVTPRRRFNWSKYWTPQVVLPAGLALIMIWSLANSLYKKQPPRRVTLVELEKATKDRPFLAYQGVVGSHHRFRTSDGAVYLVDRREWTVPTLAGNRGVSMFVTIQDGKVVSPDPAKLAEWMQDHPYDPGSTFDTAELYEPDAEHLPVVRHDQSKRPTLLVLTSDGDWTEKDLARLDKVLDDWLRHERPGHEFDEETPARLRPRLKYDEEKSAKDFKTILVRASNFKTEWCEPLAGRLRAEFPFLWQLEVGMKPSGQAADE